MADDRYFWAKTRRNYDFEKHGMQLYVSLLFFSTRLPLPESAYLSEMVIRVPVMRLASFCFSGETVYEACLLRIKEQVGKKRRTCGTHRNADSVEKHVHQS